VYPTNRRGERYSIMHVHSDRLSIAVVWRDDVVVLFLAGTADRGSQRLLSRTLSALAGQAFSSMWVDLAGIERIDITAVRLLLAAREQVTARGHEFVIRSPSTPAAHMLAGLTEMSDTI
jgi:anti-anti-sigma factor